MERKYISYSEYCKDWQRIEGYFSDKIKQELIEVGKELFRILCYVQAPDDNPASKNENEEIILVYWLINLSQWLLGCIGSYERMSLSGVSSSLRGIYECHIAIEFLVKLNDVERKKYIDRYDKFQYAEKMRFKRKTKSERVKAHAKIDEDYEKYAKNIFGYEQDGKQRIHRDWTAEGWDTLALTLKAGIDEVLYETYYTWPSQYIHNSPIIHPFFNNRLPIPDPQHGLKTLENTLWNAYILVGMLIMEYAKHFGKSCPDDRIMSLVKVTEKNQGQ